MQQISLLRPKVTANLSGERLGRIDGQIHRDRERITDKGELLGSKTSKEDKMQFYQLENRHFGRRCLRDNIGGRALR
jgi:hypothetical protein